MRKPTWSAALAAAAALGAAPVAAVHPEQYEVPYFAGAAEILVTDAARRADDGLGFRLALGMPMGGADAFELRYFDAGYRRGDGRDNFQAGLFVDYVRDFGALGAGGAWLAGIKPFAALGVGLLQEDVNADKHLHLALAAGGGLIAPLGWNGWALRLDGRLQPQFNGGESAAGEDYLLDYAVGLGLQIPMTWMYDRPLVEPAEPDCPLAVVDPATGRRDCSVDTDGDGVDDTLDHCPGTPEGATVDARGCLQVRVSGDADRDGVPDAQDACPGTQRGLQVDARGCVVAQRTAVPGVSFEADSARLTEQGRATLDGVAQTLLAQEDLRVEIAGHTDSVGAEAFNTLLSQRRADAVRTYLMARGVDGARLTAVGYGELEPIASNDTEDGRRANRRVELRIRKD
jgi:OmpA-OmpF porin, OOP family